MTEVAVHIGRQIKKARTDRHLTQTQLADLIDRTRSAVIDLEAGRRQLSVEHLLVLSRVLEKPVCFFLGTSSGCQIFNDKVKLLRSQLENIQDG